VVGIGDTNCPTGAKEQNPEAFFVAPCKIPHEIEQIEQWSFASGEHVDALAGKLRRSLL